MQPKIRFNNFFSNWYKSKLDEHVSFFSGLTYSPDDVQEKEDGVLVLRSSNIQNNNIVYDDNVYVNKDVVNTSYVRSGDIILVVRNGSKRLIGKHALIHSYMKDTVIGAFMTGIRAKNYYFINALLDSYSFQKQIYKNLGATINQITNRDLHNMCFFFPDSLDEQKKVGYFFSILDQIIEQANQQLKQYQSLKKGLLQKLFPCKDDYYPKVRFYGFNNAWNEIVLKDIVDIERGLTYKPSDQTNKDGVMVVRSSNIERNKFVFNKNDVFVKKDIISIPFLNAGDIVITAANGSVQLVGKHTMIKQMENIKLVHGGFMLKICSNYGHFINQWMSTSSYNRQIKKMIQGGMGALGNISSNSLKKLKVKIPSENEQIKIVNLLEKLDRLIELQEKKVNKLKALKQGLLQRMFC